MAVTQMRMIPKQIRISPLLLVLLLTISAPDFAQRGDTMRDTRIGGARDGAVDRSQNSEDPQLKTELKKLSKELNVSSFQLRKEFDASAKTYAETTKNQKKLAGALAASAPAEPYLTAEQFAKAKRASVAQNLPVQQIIKQAAMHRGDIDAAVTAIQKQERD